MHFCDSACYDESVAHLATDEGAHKRVDHRVFLLLLPEKLCELKPESKHLVGVASKSARDCVIVCGRAFASFA